MMYLFLAEGFEEVEALAPLDILRRGGVNVKTVGVTGTSVTGSHGVTLLADLSAEEVVLDDTVDGIILPGGMPGTLNLEASDTVQAAIAFCAEHKKLLCAICAAPSVFGHLGLLEGKRAVCFPGFEKDLTGATVGTEPVAIDQNIITSRGAGTALLFGRSILAALAGEQKANEILAQIQYPQ